MFERLKRLFESKEITIDGLKKAVEKGLISEEQFLVISGQDYE